MVVEFSAINDWLVQYILPFCRLSGMLISMAVISSRTVTPRVKILLALAISIAATPMITIDVKLELFSISMVIQILLQTLIGIGVGFITRLVFETFVIAGQVIAMQTGLGFASLIDQNTGVSVPALGQMFVMMATLIFLSIDGHLRLIELVVLSFATLPIQDSGLFFVQLDQMIYWAEMIFLTAFMMVLSAIVALLVMNLCLGVVTRSAPQLNIFAVGFPIMTVVGLSIIWLLLRSFLPHFMNQMARGNEMVCQLLLMECAGG
ncbi:flagellar biosynthetic protein FliR [Pleionea sediminis]|uniref:flagellar biosynthetic protein FliR n=1 Tax=Pleionea sediminis TaxID=2569479 RepID=UPI0011866EF1|nr:flagellar biosynthetic protein FliR [Pleionea sediminis]